VGHVVAVASLITLVASGDEVDRHATPAGQIVERRSFSRDECRLNEARAMLVAAFRATSVG